MFDVDTPLTLASLKPVVSALLLPPLALLIWVIAGVVLSAKKKALAAGCC